MSIKQERVIREVVRRFEIALSKFKWDEENKKSTLNQSYFNHVISRAARQYTKNYLSSHVFAQLFGSQRSSSLDSIYIRQRFESHTLIRSFESVEELEEAFSLDLQRSTHCKGSNLSGLTLANEEEYLSILGHPAFGKTTFLQFIGLEALRYPEGDYNHDVIPVFIQAWRLCQNTDALLIAIAEEFEKSGFPSPKKLAIWMLERGKLLVLLDGLNEAVLSQKYLSLHLRDFVTAYPRNRYIISDRLDSYQNCFEKFLEVVIQPWDDLHVQEYIHKWFAIAYEPDTSQSYEVLDIRSFRRSEDLTRDPDIASKEAQRCWKILQSNSIARELSKSPLALSLLCLICARRHSIPVNSNGLYRKALNLILEEEILKHQLNRNEGESILSTDVLDLLLAEIACKGLEERQIFLPVVVATKQIQRVLAECSNGCSHYLQNLEVDFVINLLQQVGIFRAVSSNSSSGFLFSHTTFQEYFAALHIYNHNQIEHLVVTHLSDRHWQLVFLLLAGMMVGNTEKLLLCIEAHACEYINSTRLIDILDWIEQINFNPTGALESVTKRLASLFLARPRFVPDLKTALILTRVLSLARDLYQMFDKSINFDKIFESDLSLSLAHALDFDSATELNLAIQLSSCLENSLTDVDLNKKYINFTALNNRLEAHRNHLPSYDRPFEERDEFRRKISSTWLQTLYLPAELDQISLCEVEALQNYLYANLLMVRCKQTAIAICTNTWSEIESRMLTRQRVSFAKS